MSTVEDIEKAVSSLQPDELARFRRWFEEFDARIERDARSGKLDLLAEEALADMRDGRTRNERAHHFPIRCL